MSIIHVYDGIYKYLSNNKEILDLLEIGEDATPLEKAYHIQKRSKPQNLAENLPLITFYTPGGERDIGNSSVFQPIFIFDIYTSDDVEKAMAIASQLLLMFNKQIPIFDEVTTMECRFEDGHESEADLPNVYCFTIIFSFSIEIE